MDYKATLNLPKTSFPMKANLPQHEPEVLARWEKERLYDRILTDRKEAPAFILHDGPPYANGDIHIGHALNKILKDFIIRYRTLRGARTPYVPGWDCHGLPIEHALMKELKVTKHQVEGNEFRKQAREYALKYVRIQREQFKRLGLLGDWDHPYLTLEPGYVAAELRALAHLVRKGYLYRARKPVNWCWNCETALAEAEVEYEQHLSPSIYVKFQLVPESARVILEILNRGSGPRFREDDKVYLVIWTTTPWTLLGNVAVAVHPDFEYAVRQVGPNEAWVTLAKMPPSANVILRESGGSDSHWSLPPTVPLKRGIGGGSDKIIRKMSGREMEGLSYEHPMGLRQGKVVLADYVSAEDGTGLVHIAPGFGAEDFSVGRQYGLETLAPVDSQGRFTGLAGKVASLNGRQVQEANPAIIELLQKSGHLLQSVEVEHPYPHCWRCREPIIFRATDQWFLNVEQEGLREKLLQAIETEVRWVPPAGKERMAGMIKTRPDWCLSRQRLWGVPVPALVCENAKCKGSWLVPELIDRFAQAAESVPDGVDRWFTDAYKEWIPKDFSCLDCGGETFTQGTDILDVWFDSGVSHQGALGRRSELAQPADLYLEGSDQHRGWFQVSLITGVALSGKAPYRSVLTHGFVVDGEGRKMSKSLNNVIAPQEVISSMGADVLRLWVASSDYAEDVRLSPAILAQAAESYRKIRNTLRYCLSNLYDFTPALAAPLASMQSLDRWILAELGLLAREAAEAYDQYAFHRVAKAAHEFCTVRLSNFYLDVLKDLLYTALPDDPRRRSAQTALWMLARTLTRILAPLLPVTAEEVWDSLPGLEPGRSVHLEAWPAAQEFPLDEKLRGEWTRLLQVRDLAMKALEKAREAGLIGDALEAVLEIRAGGEWWIFLEPRREHLSAACIVSDLRLTQAGEALALEIQVEKSTGTKCQRCWMRLASVGRSAQHPGLCHRCVRVVEIASLRSK